MKISTFVKMALCIAGICILYSSNTNAQSCTTTDELLKMPGKFTDHNWTPAGGHVSSYTAAEKSISVKTMNSLEAIFKKTFFGNGCNGKASFGFKEGDYFGNNFLGTYAYNIGFYNFYCDNGKIGTAHEFGTSIDIAANVLMPPALHIPDEMSFAESKFYIVGNRKDRSKYIPLFSYVTFQSPEEVQKTLNGTGYIEGKEMRSDAYDPNPGIYRTWYISPPEKKLLITITRKEYLESLLQYYEIEKEVLQQDKMRLIKTDKETLLTYEKEKNGKYKKDYNYFLNSITENEKKLAHIIAGYDTKKATVTGLLQSKSPGWLKEPAVINPDLSINNYCDHISDYNKTGYFTFNDFFSENGGCVVYKWNPDLFKQPAACTPVFFRIQIRYKKDVDFSTAIRDYYTKNLDFDAIKKILANKQ